MPKPSTKDKPFASALRSVEEQQHESFEASSEGTSSARSSAKSPKFAESGVPQKQNGDNELGDLAGASSDFALRNVASQPRSSIRSSVGGPRRQLSRVSERRASNCSIADDLLKVQLQPWELFDSPQRRQAARVLSNPAFDNIMGVVILVNFVLLGADTDFRADGTSAPVVLSLGLTLVFLIFLGELLLRVFVEREATFSNPWNLLDLFVVVAGVLEQMLMLINSSMEGIGLLKILRALRLLRLLRLLHAVRMWDELRRLLGMMKCCFKTICWCSLLCFVVMTVWSIIAVELLNPLVQQLDDDGFWGDCDRCRRSYSSVMHANLTLFQTIIAGDSWGSIAIPITEVHTWTAIIFLGSYASILFGVVNLIVAVVIDTTGEKREVDSANKHAAKNLEERKALARIFNNIDRDGSGAVSLEEMQEGAGNVIEFRERLRAMDIQEDDLIELFAILDEDGSGEVDPEEFIEALYRFKTGESKSSDVFVKQLVKDMRCRTELLEARLENMEERMTSVGDVIGSSGYDVKMTMSRTVEQEVAKCEASINQALKSQQKSQLKAFEGALDRVAGMVAEASKPPNDSIGKKLQPKSGKLRNMGKEDYDDDDGTSKLKDRSDQEKIRTEAKDINQTTPRSVTSVESGPFFSVCGDVKRGTSGHAVGVSQDENGTSSKKSNASRRPNPAGSSQRKT